MAEEVRAEETRSAQNPKKRRISMKAVGLIAAAAVVAVLAIVAVIQVKNWKNDGARFAERLSEQIGVSPVTAQKYAHITLENASKFACVNIAAEEYKYLCESSKTVQVSGVSIPEWVIYVGEKDDTVTDVQYYNYAQLQKYGNGVKTQAHVEVSGVTAGMEPAAVQQYVGFAPLRTAYTNKGKQEAYKYYYKDQNTGNTVSYVLYVEYVNNAAVSVSEAENQFIVAALMLGN